MWPPLFSPTKEGIGCAIPALELSRYYLHENKLREFFKPQHPRAVAFAKEGSGPERRIEPFPRFGVSNKLAVMAIPFLR